jgi:pSer/pThr/pTyr-binding forkhead associated (FHA) protein
VIISVFKDNQLVSSVSFEREVAAGVFPVTFYIGRSADCHIVLDDKQVSRSLAQLSYDGKSWRIKKESSFGQLTVNGQIIEEKILVANDVIGAGKFSLSVDGLSSSTIAPVFDDVALQEEKSSLVTPMIDRDDSHTETVMEEEIVPVTDGPESFPVAEDISDDISTDTEDDFGGSDGFLNEESSPLDEESQSEESGFEDSEYSAVGDDGFEVAALDDEDDSDDGTRVINAFATTYFEIDGEFAPYDKFVLDKAQVYVGRDPEKCQIVLQDPEVSSIHALIKKNNVTCTIEDLQSANGTLVNGQRTNKIELTNGDEVVIGSTTLTLRITSEFVKEEEDRLMPVEDNQVVEVEEIVEVDTTFSEGDLPEGETGFGDMGAKSQSLFTKDALKDPEKRKKILYIVVGLMLLWTFMDDGEQPASKQSEKTGEAKNQNLLKPEEEKAEQKSLTGKPLTKEELEFVDSTYLLAKELIDATKYTEAIFELEKIFQVTPEYKNARQLYEIAKSAVRKLEEIAEKERQEKERRLRMEKVKELVERAKVAVKERETSLAEGLFNEIIGLDPENFEVSRLKLEVDAYKREQERLAIEKAQKEAERKRQVDAMAPGKNFYLKKEWFNSIQKLESFLTEKNLDEDLIAEASKMLAESKENLNGLVAPLLGKARSLREGQDLKGAYEFYNQILKYDPASIEALNEMDEIRERLTARSRKIYREAIISESLSLFQDAKEKFQEVQQVSPSDSEYYRKATEKLKEYLE